MAQGSVVACKTAASFVDHVWELFGPLLGGASTVVLPTALLLRPADLAEVLAKHRVTHLVRVRAGSGGRGGTMSGRVAGSH